MKYLGLFLLFIFFLILEASLLSLPLILILLIAATVIFKDYSLFLFAFLFGLIFDILTFQTIGKSSVFFTILVFIIFSYQKKFEITTNYFVIASSFLASIAFGLIYGLSNMVFQTVISTLIALLLFNIFSKLKSQNSNLKTTT